MIKKIVIILSIVALIFVIGGIGGVLMDRYVFPFLATQPQFAQIDFLKKITERTTIINTTQEVVVTQDNLVRRIVTNTRPAIVQIISTVGTQEKYGTGILLTGDGLVGVHISGLLQDKNAQYHILLSSGKVYSATLDGIDTMTDIAFIKIANISNLPIVTFMRAEDLFVGQRIVAITPTSSQDTQAFLVNIAQMAYTENIAEGSALSDKWEGLLHIVPSENIASQGAIIINDHSEVAGIVGIASAQKPIVLPVSAIQSSLHRFIAGKIDVIPHMNIEYATITSDDVMLHDNITRQGVKILRTNNKVPSRMGRTGLFANDIIVAIDDMEITKTLPLPQILSRYNAGDVVHAKILRSGQEKTILITL